MEVEYLSSEFSLPSRSIGSSIFSEQVKEGIKLKLWNTIPIYNVLVQITLFSRNSAVFTSDISHPNIFIIPLVGLSKVEIKFKKL